MNDKTHIINQHVLDIQCDALAVEAIEPMYLDAIYERNNAPLGSKEFHEAMKESNKQENLASLFAFDDECHSFTESLEEACLMRLNYVVNSDVFMAGAGRPISIKKGTTAYRRYGRYHVLCFKIHNGKRVGWECFVPDHCVDVAE